MVIKGMRCCSANRFRIYLLFATLLFFPRNKIIEAQDFVPDYNLHIGYFGNNLWNPGLSAGISFLDKQEERTSRKGKAYNWQKFYTLQAGFYVDPGAYAGLIANAGIEHRRFKEGKMAYSFGISPVGIYRSVLPETYKVSNEGEVSKVTLPGRFYFAPGISFGLDKAIGSIPGTSWFAAVDFTGLIPYNTYVMVLVNTKLGIRVKI